MARDTSAVLELHDVAAGYGRMPIVRDVDMEVQREQLASVIGPNGAGKSTVLKAILGFNRLFSGSVLVDGHDVTASEPHERVARGIGYVPQGRQVFPDLTVRENLRMGGFLIRDRNEVLSRTQKMFDIFPRLADRSDVPAGQLSGGEQQMLAMGRALMTEPRILLLDEPTLGLAPALIERVMEKILDLRKLGLSMLMVEQNATMALQISDVAYVIDQGTVSAAGRAADLLGSDEVRRLYLGVTA